MRYYTTHIKFVRNLGPRNWIELHINKTSDVGEQGAPTEELATQTKQGCRTIPSSKQSLTCLMKTDTLHMGNDVNILLKLLFSSNILFII